MATRKLRDRLAVAAGLQMTEEPIVSVPAADKTQTLKEVATQGMEAITALYAERNTATELAADLNQKLNYVQAINVGLRDELNYYKQQCMYLTQANARLGAYLAQQHDTFQRISSETQRVNAAIAGLPQPAPLSNNPDLPRISAVGLPIEERKERQFDHNGVPLNSVHHDEAAPAPISHEDLQAIINGRGEAAHA